MRGQVRPVLLVGSRSFVDKAIKEAEQVYDKLKERGVAGGCGCGCGMALGGNPYSGGWVARDR